MIGLIAALVTVVVIVGVLVILDNLVSVFEQDRSEQAVNQAHLQAIQAAQRIHNMSWQARQALLDEAKRSQSGQ